MRYIDILNYMRKKVVVIFMITILSIYINISTLIVTAPPNVNLSVLDTISMQLGGGSISAITLSFPIIPLFCFLILNIISYDRSNMVLSRLKKRENMWIKQIKITGIIASIYSIIIVGASYIIGGSILGDFTNRWGENTGYLFEILGGQASWLEVREFFTTPVVLILITVSLILGLILIGILTLILNLFIKNIFAFVTITAFVFLDALINDFSYILKYMYISVENLMYVESIVLEKIVLIVGIIFLYKVGEKLIKKKDFI